MQELTRKTQTELLQDLEKKALIKLQNIIDRASVSLGYKDTLSNDMMMAMASDWYLILKDNKVPLDDEKLERVYRRAITKANHLGRLVPGHLVEASDEIKEEDFYKRKEDECYFCEKRGWKVIYLPNLGCDIVFKCDKCPIRSETELQNLKIHETLNGEMVKVPFNRLHDWSEYKDLCLIRLVKN